MEFESVNNQEGTERRKQRRLPFIEDILLDNIFFCTSVDISESGIFVSGILHFDENDVVEIAIPLREEQIRVKGQVKNCQPGVGAGLEFIDLNDEQIAKIRKLIESIAKP